MNISKTIIIILLFVSILNAEEKPSVLLLGRLGAEYSQMEDISKTHNNPFIPTLSIGFELPSYDFLHIYIYYNYSRKMGYPLITNIRFNSDLQIISIEEWIDKEGTFLIEKKQLFTGLKGRIKIKDFYINCGIGISPYVKSLYDIKRKISTSKIKSQGFAGLVYSLDFDKSLTEDMFLRLSADYLHFPEKVFLKNGTLFCLQIGYRLKIKAM